MIGIASGNGDSTTSSSSHRVGIGGATRPAPVSIAAAATDSIHTTPASCRRANQRPASASYHVFNARRTTSGSSGSGSWMTSMHDSPRTRGLPCASGHTDTYDWPATRDSCCTIGAYRSRLFACQTSVHTFSSASAESRRNPSTFIRSFTLSTTSSGKFDTACASSSRYAVDAFLCDHGIECAPS